MRLLIPSRLSNLAECESDLLGQFALDRSRTTISIVAGPRQRTSATSRMSLRDRAIVQAADLLVPISISPDGTMAKLIAEAEGAHKMVCREFEIPYSERNDPIAYRLSGEGLNRSLDVFASEYLIHWTRAPHCRWPDEREIDYYRAIFDSTTYPRSAFATLGHIVATKCLRGSSRHMPGGEPCVSFSAALPSELLPLMRWRARYRQMSFEPYGIGIKRDVALSVGIKPVMYAGAGAELSVADESWLRQSVGVMADWRQEKEHRFRGDLSLERIPRKDFALFCRTNDEAEQLRQSFGLSTIPFYC